MLSKKYRNNSRTKISPVKIIVFVIFALYALSLIFPVVWAFLMSMMSRAEFNMPSAGIKFPTSFNLSNYIKVWGELDSNGYSMGTMLVNSIWYAVLGAASCTIACAAAAYVTTKYEFPGRKIIIAYAWATMMIPTMGTMASNLKFLRTLNATDSPLYLLAIISGVGVGYVYMVSVFKGVSKEFYESAAMDGAGHFTIFFKIMFPQAKSVSIALFVQAFIGMWNDVDAPLIYLPSMPTLSTGLYVYQVVASRSINYPLLFAALVMVIIPTVSLFIKFSEDLMNLNLGGGIKG